MSASLLRTLRLSGPRRAGTGPAGPAGLERGERSASQRLLRHFSALTGSRRRHAPGRRLSGSSETSSSPRSSCMFSEEVSSEERRSEVAEDTSSPEYMLKRRLELLARTRNLKQRNVQDAARVAELYGGPLLTKEHHAEAQSLTEAIARRKHDLSTLKLRIADLQERLTALGVSWRSTDMEEEKAEDAENLCQFCGEEEANAYFLCSHPKRSCLECAEVMLPNVARCPTCQKAWKS